MSSPLKPVVVVTGASKGIGLAVATTLLDELNAIVVAISRTQTPEVLKLLRKYPARLLHIKADVTDEPAIREAIALALKTYSHIDSLILNAGILEPFGKIGSPDSTVDGWRKHFDVNLFSLVYTIQAALPALQKSEFGGRVIFVSSGAATGGAPAWGPYSAGKAAMNSLCRTLAREEPDIVSVSVRPGMVDTQMQELIRTVGPQHIPEADLKKFVDAHKEGKLVKPEDSGYVIAALSLKAPKSLSGEFVNWDGEECREFRRSR